MKPNFALTLSLDGIGLLHRSETGWMSVSDIELNDPDLAGSLEDVLLFGLLLPHAHPPRGVMSTRRVASQNWRRRTRPCASIGWE